MGTAGEKNLWVERISASPSSQTTPPIHLSAFPSLHNAVCWYCCAYVLNNNCLSGSSVGHELWWRDCTRAGEKDRTAAGKENEVRLHSHGKDIFIVGRWGNITWREGRQTIHCLSVNWDQAKRCFSRITDFTGWLSKGQKICRNHKIESCRNPAICLSFIYRKWGTALMEHQCLTNAF